MQIKSNNPVLFALHFLYQEDTPLHNSKITDFDETKKFGGNLFSAIVSISPTPLRLVSCFNNKELVFLFKEPKRFGGK
ncbi:hypothetical protein WDW89_10195 [Deltaproteobacteria bacterium TL4]